MKNLHLFTKIRPLKKVQGRLILNGHELYCILPEENAPEGIEVQWSCSTVLHLIFRTKDKEKARSKHHKVLPQVRAMYKEVWGEDAEILTSKHTARSRSGTMEAQDKEVHLNIAMFTPMAMIPTSVVIAYFVWGIKRLRRGPEDVAKTAENLIALWAFTFSVIREGCCRLVRHDGARFSFMINPSSQAPFLHCMFTAEFRQELDTQWKMMFSSRTRPQWMRTSDVNCASVIEVLLFLLWPTHGKAFNHIQPLAFSVLQQFSKMVDRMGKATKQDLLGENIKYKNKQMFSESLERRKQNCADFLFTENEPWLK